MEITINDELANAIYERDMDKILKNLKILECEEPKIVVEYIENILNELNTTNEQYEAQLDVLETIGESIEILKNDCEDKLDKINNVEDNFKAILPAFANKSDEITKNKQIIDILNTVLYKFKNCKDTYPRELPKLFTYINDRNIYQINEVVQKIKKYSKKDVEYIQQQIDDSYTLIDLKNEIKDLKAQKDDEESNEKLRQDLNVLHAVRQIKELKKHNIKQKLHKIFGRII